MTLETGTRITLRLDPSEKRRLEAEARVRGETISDVVRRRLRLGPTVQARRDETQMAGNSLLISCQGCGALTRKSEIRTINVCRMCVARLADNAHENSVPGSGEKEAPSA